MPYKAHLLKDKKLKPLVQSIPLKPLVKRKSVFMDLCSSIMSQQLSTKVAEVIFNRYINLFNSTPQPHYVLSISHDKLRAIGLSHAKTVYIRNIAEFAQTQGLGFKKLDNMSDDELIAYLTQIKGVGRWTAEMLMMFSLGRQDVFAVDDYGIQVSMAGLYKIKAPNKKDLKAQMLAISDKWKPYRTYACMYLWRWKDVVNKS